MNGFLKGAAVFIGGVIVVIDVVSWKDPSLLHSDYRLPDPATDNAPPLPRKGTFARTTWTRTIEKESGGLSSPVNFQRHPNPGRQTMLAWPAQ